MAISFSSYNETSKFFFVLDIDIKEHLITEILGTKVDSINPKLCYKNSPAAVYKFITF